MIEVNEDLSQLSRKQLFGIRSYKSQMIVVVVAVASIEEK